MPPAFLAPVVKPDLPAPGAAPAPDLDLDDPAFLLEVEFGIVGIDLRSMGRSRLERAPGSPRIPEREETMGGRVHLPGFRLARPAHAPADPGAGAGPQLQAADVQNQIQGGCFCRR